MSGWSFYLLNGREDRNWQQADACYPAGLRCQIEMDFHHVRLLRVPPTIRVWLNLAFSSEGLATRPSGFLFVPDRIEPDVRAMLRGWQVYGRWWTLRRAHFGSKRAQDEWEALL